MLGVLVPNFPTQTHIFFWREIRMLRELGVKVAVLSTNRPPPDACRHDFADAAAKETHYVFPPSPLAVAKILLARPLRHLRALRYIAGLKESSVKQRARALGLLLCAADLVAHARRVGIRHVHAHSCADAAHIMALMNILGGPTYSLTLHGDLHRYGVDHRSKLARCVCVGCDGPHLKDELVQKTGYPAERILPNWMGLDTSTFRETERSFEPGRLHLVTVARLNVGKGHRFALAAMRQAIDAGCDIRYTLAGEGPHRAEVEAEIRRLSLEDRVQLLGTCSEDQVRVILQQADAFVLPSSRKGEAGPISLMEAMSSGLPAVVSIIGSTPHMLQDGVSGILVEQEDVAGLAEAFIGLARDVDRRRSIGIAARRWAVEHFDCRDTTARLLAFIEQHSGHQLAAKIDAATAGRLHS